MKRRILGAWPHGDLPATGLMRAESRGVAEMGGRWGRPPPKSWVPKNFIRGTLMICPKFEILGGSVPPKLVRPSRNFFPATTPLAERL